MKRSAVLIGTGLVILAGALTLAARHPDPLPPRTVADRVVVDKSDRVLRIYRDDQLLKAYEISLGRTPEGPKQREGDGRTPEGTYVIDFHKRDSAFHRALHVSYPSAEDAARAKAAGVSPGGDIMVHGIRNGLGFLGRAHRLADWTEGCIAVTNREIEELWHAVPDGTRIEIRP